MCIMDRIAMFSRFGFSVTLLLLSLWHGAHGARMLSGRFQGEQKWPELPPCKDVPGGIPNWDCFDPPTHDLPPCDFKHQRPGVDCWPKTHPPASKVVPVTGMDSVTAAGATSTHHGVQSAVPDSSSTPSMYGLPPCTLEHYHIGIDCWPTGNHPPASKVMTVTGMDSVTTGGALSTDHRGVQSSANTHESSSTHHLEGMLPPWKDVPGGIQNSDRFNPSGLPPCDLKHYHVGIDCWPRIHPPALKAMPVSDNISATAGTSECVGLDC